MMRCFSLAWSQTLVYDCVCNYVLVLFVQYFPGRPSIKSALKIVDSWLQHQGTEIKYSDFRDVLDNTVQVSQAEKAFSFSFMTINDFTND